MKQRITAFSKLPHYLSLFASRHTLRFRETNSVAGSPIPQISKLRLRRVPCPCDVSNRAYLLSLRANRNCRSPAPAGSNSQLREKRSSQTFALRQSNAFSRCVRGTPPFVVRRNLFPTRLRTFRDDFHSVLRFIRIVSPLPPHIRRSQYGTSAAPSLFSFQISSRPATSNIVEISNQRRPRIVKHPLNQHPRNYLFLPSLQTIATLAIVSVIACALRSFFPRFSAPHTAA